MENKILKAIIENWKDIGGLLVGIWGLFVIGKKVYFNAFVPIKGWVKKMEEAAEQLDFNGGSSTKDMVKEIRDGQSGLIKKVDIIGNRQTALIELNDSAMFENDAEGNCIRANAALCKMFGSTPNQMFGYGWLNFIKNPDHEREVFEQAVETDNEITRDYTILYGGNGHEIPATYIAHIKRDEHGGVVNVTGKVFLRKQKQ